MFGGGSEGGRWWCVVGVELGVLGTSGGLGLRCDERSLASLALSSLLQLYANN